MSWKQDVRRVSRQIFIKLRWVFVMVAVGLYAVSGLYSVDADQRAVERLTTLIASLEKEPELAKKRVYLETLKEILEKANVRYLNRDQ